MLIGRLLCLVVVFWWWGCGRIGSLGLGVLCVGKDCWWKYL